MPSGTAGVAVVGCGYWGKNLVRNFAELGYLKAIVDPIEAHSAPLIERFDVPGKTLDEVLADCSIIGISIAAPASLHCEIAIRAFSAGKHVLVEKPIALTLSDARKMMEAAEQANKLLMVGHLLNYHSGFVKVLNMVSSGVCGRIQHIYSNRLSFGKLRAGENVLTSFAPHDLSMILRLVEGESPKTVQASGNSHVSENLIDFCHVQMTFESGVTAHTFVSWLNPFKEQKLVVIGSDAMIVFDDTLPLDQKVGLYRHRVKTSDGIQVLEKADVDYQSIQRTEPLKNECQAFIDGMESPESIYTDGAEGIRVLEVLSRAYSSLDNGNKVT